MNNPTTCIFSHFIIIGSVNHAKYIFVKSESQKNYVRWTYITTVLSMGKVRSMLEI